MNWVCAGVSCIVCDHPTHLLTEGFIAPFMASRTGIPSRLGRTRFCSFCGLKYCNVRYTKSQIKAIYGDYWSPAYIEERDKFDPGYAEFQSKFILSKRHPDGFVENMVLQHIDPKRVLDFGAADGRNTPFRDRAVLYNLGDPTRRVPLIW